MDPIKISINEDMTKFMIRNILGHEPCHDFNPAGAGSRYVKLNKQLENVKINGIYQEGGSGKYDGMKVSAPTDSVFSVEESEIEIDDGNDNDDVTINIYADMKDESPSTVFNRIAINEKKEDEKKEDEKKKDEKEEDRSILAPNVDEDGLIDDDSNSISNVFYSILGNDYKSFLKEFDVDADNMNNTLELNAPNTDRSVTRSMTQIRSNTINGIQSITEMTEYIRMYMFNYIAGYKSASNDVAGLKSSGRKGGRMNKPNELMIKEEIEENNDNALMSIENKKKKKQNDIATTIKEGEFDLKQGIQEGESDLKQGIQEVEEAVQATVAKEEAVASTVEVAEAAKAAEAEASIAEAAKAASIAEASEAASTAEAASTEEAALTEEAASTAEATISDRYQEYSYLNNALTHIIKEFDEYDKLDDDALIDVWSIDTDISRPCLKETKNIFVFYQYIFNYYINNINNILSSYLVNDSYFIRDAIFFFFINHFNSNEEKFLEITDEEKKKGILNEIFNLRIPEWSDDNKYLASIKKNKKEEIVEKQFKEKNIDIKNLPGQQGGGDDDEPILSLQIIKMVTGLESIIPEFNAADKTVTIGDAVITNQDQLILVLQTVYESLITNLIGEIQERGVENYQVPTDDFGKMIDDLQRKLIGEYVLNPKSIINQLKPKKSGANGSLFTLIKKYITPPTPGATVSRGSDPKNLEISINNAINTITTNLKARIIRLVSVVRYNKIKIQGTKSSSLSSEAQVPVNMILQTVCEKVNDIIETRSTLSAADNNRAAQTYANNGDIFLTQKHIIDKIATGGSTSDVDTKLYNGFKNWLNKNLGINKQVYGDIDSWKPKLLKEFIQKTGTQPVKVINNALSDKASTGEKMIKVLSDYKTSTGNEIFQIKCPISSIFDAQGSFGSCNFGLNTRKSKNVNGKQVSSNRHNAEVITDNMFIEIKGMNGFLITVNLTFKAKTESTGRAILIYTITPGQNYKDNNGGYKTITGKIDSVIRDEAIDILSAKTVFSDVFNNITAKLGNGSLTEYLTGANAIYDIMSGLTQKFMGDFGQELNAIATNFGRGGSSDSYTLLADGDRPSFVRACLLRLLATSGIDSKSYLWFMSPKGGVAVGPPEAPPTSTKGKKGGTIKKKTKKNKNNKKKQKTKRKQNKKRKSKTRKNKQKMKKSKKTMKKR